jgi:cytochrome c oxidase subunit 4
MNKLDRRLIFGWLGLLALAAIEFGCSYFPLARSLRPLLLVPALAMVATVALLFMRVGTGPAIVRSFAIAGVFWLIILLGLGTMDPMTRAIYPVQSTELP